MIKKFHGEDFHKEVSKGVTLVDFYADWCGPCKRVAEILETIDNISILKVNTDEYSELAFSYGVMSIPTLILFKDGVDVAKLIGLQSKDDIIDFINGEYE